MSRRRQDIKEIREARQKKADAERRRMLDRFKQHHVAVERERQARDAALEAKRSRFSALSVSDALAAARRLTFVDLEAEGARVAVPLNRPSLAMLELFLKVLRQRNSVAILQWPRGSRDMSILHPLAMLAMIGSSPERVTSVFKWCPAVADFRTVYYPWRGCGTGSIQRRVLVDRNEITKRNGVHLTRGQVGEAELSPELGKLHITLGHLNHLKRRDAAKPHLAHPTLGELYPTFGCLGGEDAPRPFTEALYELFGRVRHGAAIDQLQDHRAEICQPTTAPFAFFGICPRSNVKSALHHPALSKGRAADACILDLGPPGLARLGPAWEDAIEEFLQMLVTHHPETPVFAVTQDIYVHWRMAHLLATVGLTARPSAAVAPPSRVIVRSSDDCFAVDPDIGAVTEAGFQFHSAGGQGAAALRALSDAARTSSDPSTAGLLRHSMGNVRRALPAERLRPHAPQHWREFRAFMEVINIPPALADTIWREGIEPLRIDRRRAGARMAQAFVSVLVDPHGGPGSMPSDVKEGIARLRRQAMEHLDGVLAVRRQDQREDVRA